MALHDLLAGGMKFADELVEAETSHRPAAFPLGGDEFVEDLAEMSLFNLIRRAGLLEQLFRDVRDLGRLFGIVEAIVEVGILLDDCARASWRVVWRRGPIVFSTCHR